MRVIQIIFWGCALLVLPIISKAQDLAGRTIPTQIEGLTTASQVQQFVREQKSEYHHYEDFILTDSLSPDCANQPTCAPSGKKASWLKADFDGNGRIDLLVVGYRSSTSFRRFITCFLDQGEQKLEELRLAAGGYNCDVPQLGYVQGKPVVCYAHLQIKGARFAKNRKLLCRLDTLIFKKNGFVEYNQSPRNYGIEKVAFSTTECYGTCPIFSLQIARSGAAIYHADAYNDRKGNFKAVVQAQSLTEIWTLLNYLNFPKLQDDYAISATDHPTCTLTITYAGGKVKTIRDYGEQGTFGLSQLYQLLFALRTTQDWR